METSAFAAFIKKRRLEIGKSQRKVDLHVGAGSGWLSRVEQGEIATPPDRKLCAKLAEALELDEAELWERAAPDRLRALDRDVWDWHLRQIRGSRVPGAITDDERALLEEMRDLDRLLPFEESIAGTLSLLFTTLGAHLEDEASAPAAQRFVDALRSLVMLPADTELELLDVLSAQIRFATTHVSRESGR